MVMREDNLDAVVLELEKKARLQPERYAFGVTLLAIAGNIGLGLIIIATTSLFLLAASWLLRFQWMALIPALLLGIFLWNLLRALMVRQPAPAGLRVSPAEAPLLFDILHDIRDELSAPPLHRVLITEDFNASVVQTSQLWLLGWHHNYLLVGLPLMKSLTTDQFKAVLAHELGHLSRGHSRLSNWICRQRQRWSQLEQLVEQRCGPSCLLLHAFLGWFLPTFNARSFPLARANEYEADAISVRLTSARTAAEALTNVNVIASYLGERFWPAINRQADELPHPAYAPYSSMDNRFASELDNQSAELWLEQALWRKTTAADTHPALGDRLRAIGASARLNPPQAGRAADQLLGAARARIASTFDNNWRRSVLPSWQQRHQEVQKGRQRLQALDKLAASGQQLTVSDAWERARLTESIGRDSDSALEQFQQLLSRQPHAADLNFEVGARLLLRQDAQGVALLEAAMRLDARHTGSACELLRDWFGRENRWSEADAYQQRAAAWRRQEAESSRLQIGDRFDQHQLSNEELHKLRRQLATLRGLKSAWLVRKIVSQHGGDPLYVLGVRTRSGLPWRRPQRQQQVMRQLGQLQCWPGETLLLSLDGDYWRFEHTFRRIPGARLL